MITLLDFLPFDQHRLDPRLQRRDTKHAFATKFICSTRRLHFFRSAIHLCDIKTVMTLKRKCLGFAETCKQSFPIS